MIYGFTKHIFLLLSFTLITSVHAAAVDPDEFLDEADEAAASMPDEAALNINQTDKLLHEINESNYRLHEALAPVRGLLESVNPNFRGSWGATPIHHACKYTDSLDLLDLLFAYGANARATNSNGETPLHGICYRTKNVAPRIRYLLDHGADPIAQDIIGNTPLHIMCLSPHYLDKDVLAMLITANPS